MFLSPRSTAFVKPSTDFKKVILLTTDGPDMVSSPIVKTDFTAFGRSEGLHFDYETRIKGLLKVRSPNWLHSGTRSVLRLSEDDIGIHLYKIKGCMPPKGGDWEHAIPNWVTFLNHEPFGTTTLTLAEKEAEMIFSFNETLIKEGLPILYAPLAIWVYNPKWPPKSRTGQPLKRENVAAFVAEAYGDDRLDDILFHLESAIPAVINEGEVLSELTNTYRKIGMLVGNSIASMHNNRYAWDTDTPRTNAHLGNVVLRIRNENIYFGPADMDSLKYLPKGSQDSEFNALKESNHFNLLAFALDPGVYSGNVVRFGRRAGLTDNLGFTAEGTNIREPLRRGIEEGYKHPDKAEPLSVIELKETYDLIQDKYHQ